MKPESSHAIRNTFTGNADITVHDGSINDIPVYVTLLSAITYVG